jgi:hypothetical protein
VTQNAVESMTVELHSHHKKMRRIVVMFGLVLIVTAALILSRVMRLERAVGASRPGETLAPMPIVQQPISTQATPGSAVTPDKSILRSTEPLPQSVLAGENDPALHPSTDSREPLEAQSQLSAPAPHGDSSTLPEPASIPSGEDRYPGSQTVEVKDANLPNIGIPVASEVYTTSDSISTVIGYYRQRYPGAEISEVDGQKIVAVNQAGATKVIAVGTTGSETRIAIVKPVN